MFVGFELDLDAWAKSVDALGDALDDQLEACVHESAKDIAFAARADHPYTDRTERLTKSIRAYRPHGRFTRGTLATEVVANAEYASYLENRPEFAFLEPALTRSEGQIEQRLHDALEAAVRHAGLAG